MPAEEILGAFRHVRNHLEQHDRFVEMVQIIGGKPGTGIDVGGPQQRCPRGGRRRRLGWRRAVGSMRIWAAVVVIRRSLNVWG